MARPKNTAGSSSAQSPNKPGIALEDALDCAQRRTAQLQALTLSMIGEGFEPFNLMSADLKHNLLWLVHDLTDEIFDALNDATTPPTGGEAHHD